jgi:hypothetical protein
MSFPIDPTAGGRSMAEHTDFQDDGRGSNVGSDQFSHAPGKVCKKCDRPIQACEPARRKGENGWVHDTCPPALD